MEKRVIIGTSMVLLAIAAVGFVVYLIFYHESGTPVNDTPYGKSLAEPVTREHWDATWEAILNSDAAYLQDPDFDVTADNFYQSVHDLLAAPARLYFYRSDDQIECSYKCDDPEITVKFADVFQGISLRECTDEEYKAMAGNEYDAEIILWNVAVRLGIFCHDDYTCIWVSRYHMNTDSYTGDNFYVGENLHDKVVTAYEEILPCSMEAPREEVE